MFKVGRKPPTPQTSGGDATTGATRATSEVKKTRADRDPGGGAGRERWQKKTTNQPYSGDKRKDWRRQVGKTNREKRYKAP